MSEADWERYWVYENWRARGHKAVVHKAVCGFCNSGHGLAGGTARENGRWIGPFKSRREAMTAANSTGGYVIIHSCA